MATRMPVMPVGFLENCRANLTHIIDRSQKKGQAGVPKLEGAQADNMLTYSVWGAGVESVAGLTVKAIAQGAPRTSDLVSSLFAVPMTDLRATPGDELKQGLAFVALHDPDFVMPYSLIRQLGTAVLQDSKDMTPLMARMTLSRAIQADVVRVSDIQGPLLGDKGTNCSSGKGCRSCKTETSCGSSLSVLAIKMGVPPKDASQALEW